MININLFRTCNLIPNPKHCLILLTLQYNTNLLFSMIQPIFDHILNHAMKPLLIPLNIDWFFCNLNIWLNSLP